MSSENGQPGSPLKNPIFLSLFKKTDGKARKKVKAEA
jgi:hypothetical protein